MRIDGDAIIREVPLPSGIHGMIKEDPDGYANIYLNGKDPEEKTTEKNKGEKSTKSDYKIVAEDFTLTKGKNFPDDGTWCLYVWKNFDGEVAWDIGAFSKQKGCFAVTDGGHNKRITPKNRVIAWKRAKEVKLI